MASRSGEEVAPSGLSSEDVRAFLDAQLMVDPHFAVSVLEDSAPEVGSAIEHAVQRIEGITRDSAEHIPVCASVEMPLRVRGSAIRDTLITTAALTAHAATGSVHVTMNEIGRAMDRLATFTQSHGLAPLVLLYGTLIALENHKAVSYYAPMPVEDFLSGKLHQPHGSGTLLHEELATSIGAGTMAMEVRAGVPCIIQTERGRQQQQQYRAALESSGFTSARKTALTAVEMSVRDIENFIRQGAPDLTPLRHQLGRVSESG